MVFMKKPRSKTQQVALAAVFAAVYVVLRSIPTFQMIGISGRFTAGDFLLTSIALLIGLWGGALAVIIGTILAYAVNPPIFFGLDFVPALTNVSVVGLVLLNRLSLVRTLYLGLLLAFLVSPYSLLFAYDYVPYAWLHIVALIILLSPYANRFQPWVKNDRPRQVGSLAVLAFLGTMAQHLVGGLLYEAAAGVVGGINPVGFQQIWGIIFWLYPTERLVIVSISTIVAVALIRSTEKFASNFP